MSKMTLYYYVWYKVCTQNARKACKKNMWRFEVIWGFPAGSDGKESACSAGDPGSIPGLRRSPGAEHDNPC